MKIALSRARSSLSCLLTTCAAGVTKQLLRAMTSGKAGSHRTVENFLLAMKLTGVLILATCLHVSASGVGQNVTFSVRDASLQKVFIEIIMQSGTSIIYNDVSLKDAKPVTIDIKNATVEEALNLCLKDQPFSYTWKDGYIIVKPVAPTPELPANTFKPEFNPPIKISGTVMAINNQPLSGATIRVKGKNNIATTSDDIGHFELTAEKGSVLIISYVGFQQKELKVSSSEAVKIIMVVADNGMDTTEVVINTGYQKFKPNEMVGSVEVISARDLQKQVGTNILQKLKGLSAALTFNNKVTTSSASGNPNSKLNINIRGWSTINGPTDPLIILDNFPYQGDINNINPNDVESVAILKDAAATSIWGARAGNGVIVINTRRGKFGTKTSFNFSSELSVSEKPRLNTLPLVSSASFIDQELRIANSNPNIIYQKVFPFTPAVTVLLQRKQGQISAEDSAAKIDYLKSIDSREQWNKYIYRPAITQYYTLGAAGGASNIAWNLTGSYSKTRGTTQNQEEAGQISIGNKFKVSSKVDLHINAQYNFSKTRSGAPAFNSIKAKNYTEDRLIPYLQLADENGNPVKLLNRYSQEVLDTLGSGQLLDYSYYPLTDWQHDYTNTTRNSTLLNATLSYVPANGLRLEMMVSAMKEGLVLKNIKEQESFFTRDIINKFSQVDPVTKVVNRVVPLGDILMQQNSENNNLAARAQGTYIKKWGKHGISLLGSLDISENKQRTDGQLLLGYSEDPLFFSIVNMTDFYPVPFEGNTSVSYQLQAGSILGIKMFMQRFASVAASASYTYDGKYVVYSSIRKDGANILGVKANDRWKPLWSLGGSWLIDKEKFFHVRWINSLTLRSSLGISGNVDVSRSSNPVGSVIPGLPNSTLPYPYLTISTPPNPNLRWEKNMQVNWALDFVLLNGRISATTSYYIKHSRDLYARVLADYTQSPASQVQANAASMNGRGYEVSVNARVFNGEFSWNSILSFAKNTNKIKQYYNKMEPSSSFFSNLSSDGNSINEKMALFPGQSLFGLAGVRTAGVTNTGQLLYVVDGKPTPNLGDVIKDFYLNGNKASSYVYFGQSDPKINLNFNNIFNWKNWSLTVMARCRFGYYFKKAMITNNLNFNQPVYHKDYDLRWQNAGDETHTRIPSVGGGLAYYSMMSADLIKRADNIRIGNLQLTYNITPRKANAGFNNLLLALNLSDLGAIWVANNEGLDPDYDGASDFMTYRRENRTVTLTLRAGF